MRRDRLRDVGRSLAILIAAIVALLAPVRAADQSTADIAVVANSSVPVDNLSLAELRRILLGDKEFWAPGVRVTLLIRAPIARERDVAVQHVCEMTEAQFRQHWIAKVFRAEAANGPRIVYSNEMATELANAIPGAVAFVEAPQVPKGMKVLRINGLLPGDKGYPLR